MTTTTTTKPAARITCPQCGAPAALVTDGAVGYLMTPGNFIRGVHKLERRWTARSFYACTGCEWCQEFDSTSQIAGETTVKTIKTAAAKKTAKKTAAVKANPKAKSKTAQLYPPYGGAKATDDIAQTLVTAADVPTPAEAAAAAVDPAPKKPAKAAKGEKVTRLRPTGVVRASRGARRFAAGQPGATAKPAAADKVPCPKCGRVNANPPNHPECYSPKACAARVKAAKSAAAGQSATA